MPQFSKSLALLISPLAALLLLSCSHPEPLPTPIPIPAQAPMPAQTLIPSQIMEFEPGMKALAENLATQLEQSSVGNQLNKVVIDPQTKQRQLKKIVIDPFVDTVSGYPVKINPRISTILSGAIAKRFAVLGPMVPKKLEISEYVLTGMVTPGESEKGKGRDCKVYAAVFEKSSGVVHAASEVHIGNFDTTPMDIYKDSPVYLKGKNHDAHVSSAKKKRNEKVNKGYREKLSSRALTVQGDELYEDKDYGQSFTFYNRASGTPAGRDLEVLNGLFTNLVRQGRLEEAGPVYGNLLRVSIDETSGVASRVTFGPNSTVPLAAKAGLYGIYLKQIAQLVGSVPGCRVKIIGHSSRTGSDTYNDKLSLQRAMYIQTQMASYSKLVAGRTEALGRGIRDNIVGTGADDLSDEIDRRVEFQFGACGQ
jgi:outer membrane protein OmpA-like peptidoglycan-associated protein